MENTKAYQHRKELNENGIHWYISRLAKYGIIVRLLGGPLCFVKDENENLSYYTYDVSIVGLYNQIGGAK